MDFAQGMNEKFQQALGALAINMTAKASRTAVTLEEYIALSRAQGIDDDVIKRGLLTDLNQGGRIFGEFFNAMGSDVVGRLGQMSRDASNLKFGFTDAQTLVWISVSIQEGDKVCPDCEPRHMETDTFEFWKLRGLPKTGWSVCRSNCRCILMDPSQVDASITKPIRIKKGE